MDDDILARDSWRLEDLGASVARVRVSGTPLFCAKPWRISEERLPLARSGGGLRQKLLRSREAAADFRGRVGLSKKMQNRPTAVCESAVSRPLPFGGKEKRPRGADGSPRVVLGPLERRIVS
jgi:hypothetical protein